MWNEGLLTKIQTLSSNNRSTRPENESILSCRWNFASIFIPNWYCNIKCLNIEMCTYRKKKHMSNKLFSLDTPKCHETRENKKLGGSRVRFVYFIINALKTAAIIYSHKICASILPHSNSIRIYGGTVDFRFVCISHFSFVRCLQYIK